jgi:hypothetical protein
MKPLSLELRDLWITAYLPHGSSKVYTPSLASELPSKTQRHPVWFQKLPHPPQALIHPS